MPHDPDVDDVDPVDPEHELLVHLRDLLVAGAAWRARAACRGESPDHWFPSRGEAIDVPVAICRRCPVTTECLDYALDAGEHFGIWGGTCERERRRLRRARRNEGVTP